MKCPNCGANISIRAEYCAWCGKLNERSSRHVQILKRYNEATDATRSELEHQTIVRVPILIRMLVILLLILGLGISFYMLNNSWDWKYDRRRAQAVRNAPTYTVKMDELIAARDHIGFSRFVGSHDIEIYGHSSDGTYPYTRFRTYASMNDYYIFCINSVMSLYPLREQITTEEEALGRAEEYIDYFFNEYGRAHDNENWNETDVTAVAVEDMRQQIEAICVRYFGLDPATAANMANMTSAQRKYAIEEGYAALRKGGVR